jgi:protocatechuate 3,4-dioxygenase, beta subunit
MSRTKPAPFTPEATIGPFYPGVFVAQMPQALHTVAPLLALRPEGQVVTLHGRFVDSLHRPVRAVIVEIWQANAHGRYRHPADRSPQPLDAQFEGFARLCSDAEGRFLFTTVKPGGHPVRPGSDVMRAPHLRLTIFASGIDRIVTQIFFEGEALNAADPLLSSIDEPHVRERLIARRKPDGDSAVAHAYEIDIGMRGDLETPFFDDWT